MARARHRAFPELLGRVLGADAITATVTSQEIRDCPALSQAMSGSCFHLYTDLGIAGTETATSSISSSRAGARWTTKRQARAHRHNCSICFSVGRSSNLYPWRSVRVLLDFAYCLPNVC